MGDPRRRRKKFTKPRHPWQKERIEEETTLMNEYGFKNKKELWKMESVLRNFSNQAKKLIALKTSQAEKEKKQLLHKLQSLGLIEKTSQLEDILEISLKNLLDRRLQTLLFKKGFAKSINQARHFIVHGHVNVANNMITIPSYLVSKKEEETVVFNPGSRLSDVKHPERVKEEKSQGKPR